jgi:uncharacterized repeat protein (TIGR01451 family)
VQSTPPPVVVVPTPAITIVKSQRRDGTQSYRIGPINVRVGQTIDYRMVVTNTGGVEVTVTLTDQRCDAGTLRAGGTTTLAPGASVAYTCSHRLLAADPSPFVNTATATAVTPSGDAIGPVSSRVTARRTGAVLAATITRTKAAAKAKKAAQPKKVTAKAKPATKPKKVTAKAKPAKPVVKSAQFTG